MPAPDLHPVTLELIRRMSGPAPDHSRFKGVPLDLAKIDAAALGDLWALAHESTRRTNGHPREGLAAETGYAIHKLTQKTKPIFRSHACRDALDVLARDAMQDNAEREAKRAAGESYYNGECYIWEKAGFVLSTCNGLDSEVIGPAADRFLAVTNWSLRPHVAVVLARLVNPGKEAEVLGKLTAELSPSPLLLGEVRLAARLDLLDNIRLADVAHPQTGTMREASDAHYPLSALPLYVAFAEAGLKQAAAHMRQIHAGELPYASDKAFTLDESSVIARLARVALDRDEPWLPPVLRELFLKVSLAPTSAKTVPSQSVAIALGHAVEAFPTPEAVETLREVLRSVRHAGVEKKLLRNRPSAERGLAARPEIALRLPLDQPLTKPQLAALTRCLEASFSSPITLGYDDWRLRLAERAQAQSLARSLVWQITEGPGGTTTVLPVTNRSGVELQDVGGQTVAAGPACHVALWHPADAGAEERRAWRDRVTALQIKQPFKQVFREYYAIPDEEQQKAKTAMFADHVVSLRPFLGVARGAGWHIEYDELVRAIATWQVRFGLSVPVFPGCKGWATTGYLSAWKAAGGKWVKAALGELPTVVLSEALRSVDLLVSTGGFAVATDGETWPEAIDRFEHLRRLVESPLSPMAEMRKDAVSRVLTGRPGLEGLEFDSRHLRLGRYAIHLATGRVTRDGEAIEMEPPQRSNLVAVPWLPYDEKLLEHIVRTVLGLAASG